MLKPRRDNMMGRHQVGKASSSCLRRVVNGAQQASLMDDRSHRLSAAGSGESCAWELHERTSGRPAVEGVLAPPHVDGGRRRLAVAYPLLLLPPHVRAAQPFQSHSLCGDCFMPAMRSSHTSKSPIPLKERCHAQRRAQCVTTARTMHAFEARGISE